jgi:polar amino acid transport system substrate-binding protein
MACNLVIGLSSDFPPYHAKNSEQKWEGITVDLTKSLVELAGCSLSFVEAPWARSIRLLQSGDIQLISHFTMTPERSKYSQFLGPNHTEKIAFVAKNTISEHVTHATLLPKFEGTIGITRGDEFGAEFSQYVFDTAEVKSKLVNIKNNQDRVAMLLRGRLDGMFFDEMSAQRFLAKSSTLKQNYSIRFTFQATPVYWGVSHQFVSVEIRKRLNQAWLYMLKKNMIEPVYKKYGLTIDMSKFDFELVSLLGEENELQK